MSLVPDHQYVKREANRVYVRGSAFTGWPNNAFTPREAREFAAQVLAAADEAERPKTIEDALTKAISECRFRCADLSDVDHLVTALRESGLLKENA